jgi:hypothetical protein
MMKARVGDKIRVKANHARGIVDRLQGKSLIITLDGGGQTKATESEVTNYSLAARKAWERMPERRVGRPKGTTRSNRTSVTLRIDRELWEKFRLAESQGKITDRTATINKWIAENLDELES